MTACWPRSPSTRIELEVSTTPNCSIPPRSQWAADSASQASTGVRCGLESSESAGAEMTAHPVENHEEALLRIIRERFDGFREITAGTARGECQL